MAKTGDLVAPEFEGPGLLAAGVDVAGAATKEENIVEKTDDGRFRANRFPDATNRFTQTWLMVIAIGTSPITIR
jgi:hypothetical protein